MVDSVFQCRLSTRSITTGNFADQLCMKIMKLIGEKLRAELSGIQGVGNAKQHNLPIKIGSAFVTFALDSEYFLPSKSFETSLPKSAVTRSRMVSLSSISLSCFPFGDALQLESDILDLFAYPARLSP